MNVKKFKNKHLGERCFIVGNGPSLKNTKLDLIKNEFSFAMNRISMIFDFTEWRPSYYSCTTTNIHRAEWKKDIRIMLEEAGYFGTEGFSYVNKRQTDLFLIGN